MSKIETRIAALPLWQGELQIEPLVGGLSNQSFTVNDRTARYVVRCGGDFPFHHVFRDRELMVARAAHRAGFGPEIVHAEPGLMVSRFIDGKVFDAEDVRANIARIAETLRHFHEEMATWVSGPGFIFWAFHVVRDYAVTLEKSPKPLGKRMQELLAINAELEAAQMPLPIVFGHHDLLPANLIDDGKKLWVIDYEYAGFGTAMFDLAGLSSNAGFHENQSALLLETYFGGGISPAIEKSLAAMQCASLLREALWSLVSEQFLSAPGADYAAYAEENFTRFDNALKTFRTSFPKA